jgi:hypothetical protein
MPAIKGFRANRRGLKKAGKKNLPIALDALSHIQLELTCICYLLSVIPFKARILLVYSIIEHNPKFLVIQYEKKSCYNGNWYNF